MKCVGCGVEDELRLGHCYDCATRGEERAAKRTVAQHLMKACRNVLSGHWLYAKFDLSWAWQRLTRTGDYAAGGPFDWEGYDWR